MSARSKATLVALAIFGVLVATGIGVAANAISGDSVGLSADPLPAGDSLAPAEDDRGRGGGDTTATTQRTTTTTRTTRTIEPGDDHGGRSRGGSGSGGSGSSDDSGGGRGRGRGRGGDD